MEQLKTILNLELSKNEDILRLRNYDPLMLKDKLEQMHNVFNFIATQPFSQQTALCFDCFALCFSCFSHFASRHDTFYMQLLTLDRNTPQEYKKKLIGLGNIFKPRHSLNGLPDRRSLQSAIKVARTFTIGQRNRIKKLLKKEKNKLNKGKKLRKLKKMGITIKMNDNERNQNKYRNSKTKKYNKRTTKLLMARVKRKRGF